MNSVGQDPLHELTAFIEQSSLSAEDKKVWINAIPYAGEAFAQDIIDYLQEYPEKVEWATDMVKRKTEAIKNNDNAAWDQILEEEKRELENILNNE